MDGSGWRRWNMHWSKWAVILLLPWLILYGVFRSDHRKHKGSWKRLDWFASLFERYWRSCNPATTRKLEWAVGVLFGFLLIYVVMLGVAPELADALGLIAQISVWLFVALLVVLALRPQE